MLLKGMIFQEYRILKEILSGSYDVPCSKEINNGILNENMRGKSQIARPEYPAKDLFADTLQLSAAELT